MPDMEHVLVGFYFNEIFSMDSQMDNVVFLQNTKVRKSITFLLFFYNYANKSYYCYIYRIIFKDNTRFIYICE